MRTTGTAITSATTASRSTGTTPARRSRATRASLSITAGTEHVVPPHHGDYHNNAAGVGSGTFLYGAQAWRFHPDDFRMASRYGVPDGSSLVDWPIGYDDLAPYYEWVEWNVGVAGDPDPHGGPRARGYPMPPVPQRLRHELLRRGAEALGISTFIPPLLINTQALQRPRGVHRMRLMRGLRLSEQRQERHAEHDDPARAGDRDA